MIYDITQPLFECTVFPGDPVPRKTKVKSIDEGDAYNMTVMSVCVHNGTHIDAPCHFVNGAKSVEQIDITKFIGPAYVISHSGDVTGADAEKILALAKESNEACRKKILIKGKATVTADAAAVFANAGIDLIGNESQTVGPEDAPMEVHVILLKKEVVLLEGIRLSHVPDGVYMLNCAPLNLTGSDGSPCRAVLTDM